MATVLIPIPSDDFDPTEVAVPWRILDAAGHRVVFATPDGQAGAADARMLTGEGLAIFSSLLRADANGLQAYRQMCQSHAFENPLRWDVLNVADFDGMVLPGGHAPGMKTYLESEILQKLVSAFFAADKPVGAICHGTVLAARSQQSNGLSVLHGRKSTALTQLQELAAWGLTRWWLGNYYRTYPQTVEHEVKRALGNDALFYLGPVALQRDSESHLERGFTVQDGNYLSARWPGDAHRFGHEFSKMLEF